MATKNFNPWKDGPTALQYLLMLTPSEVRQQAIRAAAIVKADLDNYRTVASERTVLLSQTEILRQQIEALKAELNAVQFAAEPPEPVEEKKRGRKANV